MNGADGVDGVGEGGRVEGEVGVGATGVVEAGGFGDVEAVREAFFFYIQCPHPCPL